MDKQLRNYIIIAVVILLIVILIYLVNFASYPISKENENWGQFGAYIGGVAGVFLTLLTVILLIKTLDSQNKNATINQFESSFFELFRLHKEITDRIIGKIHIENEIDTYKGLKFFEKLSEKIRLHYDDSRINELKKLFNEDVQNTVEEMQLEVDDFYNELYSGKESELGHYFRSS